MDTKILDRLQTWQQKEGQLPAFAQLYRELLEIQGRAGSPVKVARTASLVEVIPGRLGRGVSCLPFEEFRPDWAQVQSLFEQIASWATKDSETPERSAEKLKAICRNQGVLIDASRAWYAGDSLEHFVEGSGIDQELLASTLAASLKPFLCEYSNLLLPHIAQESWLRGYCPVCNGKPDLAYLVRADGARRLLCSRCDADWLFLRLECPYCGTQDQNALGYFTDEQGKGSYRLYFCDKCHTYIKAIDLRHVEEESLLPLERVTTFNMDKQAQEMGYQPGWSYQADSQLALAKSNRH